MKPYSLPRIQNRHLPACLGMLFLLALFGCKDPYANFNEGLDVFMASHRNIPEHTVVLTDMDVREDKYYHKYDLLHPAAGSMQTIASGWKEVSPDAFQTHEGNLGMEVAHRSGGRDVKHVAPAGFSQLVGNPSYGSWGDDDPMATEPVQQDTTRRRTRLYRRWYWGRSHRTWSQDYYAPPNGHAEEDWNRYNKDYRNSKTAYRGTQNSYGTDRYLTDGKGKSSTWGKKSDSERTAARRTAGQAARKQRSARSSRSGSRYGSGGGSRGRSSGGGGK